MVFPWKILKTSGIGGTAGEGECALNTIVNKLLDVDREARQMLDEAQQYHDRTMREIEAEKQRMLSEFNEKAGRHIHELSEEQNAEVAEAVAAIQARTGAVRKSMEAHYDNCHRQWEDEIYRMVTGG